MTINSLEDLRKRLEAEIEYYNEKLRSVPVNHNPYYQQEEGIYTGLETALQFLNNLERNAKVELTVVPQHVADHIETNKDLDNPLVYVINQYLNSNSTDKETEMWIFENFEDFVLAYLNGYVIEEESIYYAKVKGYDLLEDSSNVYWNAGLDGIKIGDNTQDFLYHKVTRLPKRVWNRYGINEDNAVFEEYRIGGDIVKIKQMSEEELIILLMQSIKNGSTMKAIIETDFPEMYEQDITEVLLGLSERYSLDYTTLENFAIKYIFNN